MRLIASQLTDTMQPKYISSRMLCTKWKLLMTDKFAVRPSSSSSNLLRYMFPAHIACKEQRSQNLCEGAWGAPFRAEHDIVPGLIPKVISKLGHLI